MSVCQCVCILKPVTYFFSGKNKLISVFVCSSVRSYCVTFELNESYLEHAMIVFL